MILEAGYLDFEGQEGAKIDLGASWTPLGASWKRLGGVLGPLGSVLGRLGGVLGRLGSVLASQKPPKIAPRRLPKRGPT